MSIFFIHITEYDAYILFDKEQSLTLEEKLSFKKNAS